MKFIKNTTEEDMVATFLKAEINSPRWGSSILKLLQINGTDREIIDKPNLINEKENKLRAKILSDFRGYRKDDLLFKSFPKNMKWKRVELNKEDLQRVKYINYDYWTKLSGGSRLAVDAVKNIKKGVEVSNESNEQFWKLAKYINNGGKFTEIILICHNTEELVLLEGHVRLTSYLLAKNKPGSLEVIIGYPKS